MKFTYLLVDFFSVIFPFAFSFHPKLKFNKNFIAFIKANFIASVVFLIWDAIFTSNGVWGFNESYILGIKIYNLPLEEILFFVCIPFACVFTYHCSLILFKVKWNRQMENIIVLLFSLLLFIIGIIFLKKTYTSVTFISTAFFLVSLKLYFKADWLAQIFSVYPLLLIPFFIVNGILTGSGLEHPVVFYNDSENTGIRMLTIPVEDVVYGFELLLLNIFFYERFKNRKGNAQKNTVLS